MDRTALAEEPSAEFLQHPIGLNEGSPEPPRRVGVVGTVHVVFVERQRVRDLVRDRTDLQSNAERSQQVQVAAVEVRHGLRHERERFPLAVAGADEQPMIDKIEVDLERAFSVRNGRGPEPARRDVQDDLPPVVLHRREREPRLADDLRPELQGVAGLLPLLQREERPHFSGSGPHSVACHTLRPMGIPRAPYRSPGAGSIMSSST